MARNDRFLKACRKEPVDCTPIWMMRQAGRYLKEYRDIRSKYSFIEMCKTPELVVEVTLQPIRRFELDAAIIFADILLPLEYMGIDFEFTKDDGPQIKNPVRTRRDVEKMRKFNIEEHMDYLLTSIKLVRKELDGKVPLIGFSGAPFTLASYIIEGGGSKNYVNTKTMMYTEPDTWHLLMEKLVDMIIDYLNAQIKAGAQAIQIFDSWVGCLCPSDYKEFILPHQKRLFEGLDKSVPNIHFAFGASHLLKLVKEAGGDVIGLDWRVDIDEAWKQLNYETAVQGNLDPTALYGSKEYIKKRVEDILNRAGNRNGHIFNLGHGILPTVPVENAEYLVNLVHELSKR
ncbi:MAG: uroporphyrinogen decarboxylase [Proteobacteria bacterium]|nr:uroporphyrinogen decarboxylase [Pseudomonadota bacterium]